MKVFFDTNVWIAEALLGEAAERLIEATSKAAWRIYSSSHVLAETERVLEERLGCNRRLAVLTRKRIQRRAAVVEPNPSRHQVPEDPADSPILQAALAAGVDYLVSNDAHLIHLSPYEGLRIVTMSEYRDVLKTHGLAP